MDERLYWLWLQYVFKPAGRIKECVDKYTSAVTFYKAGESEWEPFFGNKRKGAFRRAKEKSPEDFSDTLDFCLKHGVHIITPDSEYYPKNLLTIADYPAVLFVRGNYKCLNEGVPFGVIGSRTPSVYGENAAWNIVKALTENGALIVSGGALGIDSVAHKTAMVSGGKTVVVMGCGHGYNYLSENSELRKNAANMGAVISEYAPFSPVTQSSFPERNRIISGMSKAVVIIEAADRSGTFSTANHAKRQGRDLYVLPGDIDSGNFSGSNQLISEGATAVFSGEDVLRNCSLLGGRTRYEKEKTGNVFPALDEKSHEGKKYVRKQKKAKEKTKKEEENQEKIEIIPKNLPEGISKNAEIVYNIMSDGVNELDEITRKSALQIRHVLVALTELEMLGFAACDGPNSYKII
ncbi:MAG: DNA-processing protein DprA [Clostridia bacterium]|nr:DNA-processing protein DprA [Clostridia bacterium]